MNMNFIAFSSRAKLLDWPHLDTAAAGHRHLRGHLDGLLQIPGLDQQQAGQLAVAHPDPSGGVIVGQAFLDAGVRLLPGHRVHVVLDKIHQADGLQNPPAAGEWLRTQLVVQRGPKSTAAMATRGSRPIALGTYLGAARLSIDYRVMWRGVRARAQRCADKDRSPARP